MIRRNLFDANYGVPTTAARRSAPIKMSVSGLIRSENFFVMMSIITSEKEEKIGASGRLFGVGNPGCKGSTIKNHSFSFSIGVIKVEKQ